MMEIVGLEVHVERCSQPEVYGQIKRWVLTHHSVRLLFVGTGKYRPSCKQLNALAKISPIGLHTHLAFFSIKDQIEHFRKIKESFAKKAEILTDIMDSKTYEYQYAKIKTGLDYFNDCGLKNITHFTAGNFCFNKDTIKACHLLGLTNFHWTIYPNWSNKTKDRIKNLVTWGKNTYKDMEFIYVKAWVHDRSL